MNKYCISISNDMDYYNGGGMNGISFTIDDKGEAISETEYFIEKGFEVLITPIKQEGD